MFRLLVTCCLALVAIGCAPAPICIITPHPADDALFVAGLGAVALAGAIAKDDDQSDIHISYEEAIEHRQVASRPIVRKSTNSAPTYSVPVYRHEPARYVVPYDQTFAAPQRDAYVPTNQVNRLESSIYATRSTADHIEQRLSRLVERYR